eukprot:TRINITY_DN7757_c0_g1_i2.p5 TRINITY_DN7757_c0_g1~~TRINITY_DN7757_c0_g1_i2.p5  ORF type:complete len:193 (+),score=26.78 TRINITY_DN7757_c0_g1_i2:1645-2223(+)
MFQKLKKKGSQWGGIEKGGKGVKKNDVGLCVNGNSYECLVGLVVLKMDVQMEEELVGFVYLDNKTNHSYVTDNSVLKGLLCSFQLISFQLIRLLLLGYSIYQYDIRYFMMKKWWKASILCLNKLQQNQKQKGIEKLRQEQLYLISDILVMMQERIKQTNIQEQNIEGESIMGLMQCFDEQLLDDVKKVSNKI